PGETLTRIRTGLVSKRIPAEDVLHLYRIDRPGQVRGVPWFAPVLVRLKDLDDFDDATLMRNKVAACFAAFLRDSDAPSSPSDAKSTFSAYVEPASVEVLPPGRDITFSSPPGAPGHGEYTRTVLQG